MKDFNERRDKAARVWAIGWNPTLANSINNVISQNFNKGADWAKEYIFGQPVQCPCCAEKYTLQQDNFVPDTSAVAKDEK